MLCEQVHTCNLQELENYIGTVSSHIMNKVDIALKYALGLEELPALSRKEQLSFSEEESEELPTKEKEATSKIHWTDDSKLQLCAKYEKYKNKEITYAQLMSEYNFSSLSSLQSSVRKFKRQLGVYTFVTK